MESMNNPPSDAVAQPPARSNMLKQIVDMANLALNSILIQITNIDMCFVDSTSQPNSKPGRTRQAAFIISVMLLGSKLFATSANDLLALIDEQAMHMIVAMLTGIVVLVAVWVHSYAVVVIAHMFFMVFPVGNVATLICFLDMILMACGGVQWLRTIDIVASNNRLLVQYPYATIWIGIGAYLLVAFGIGSSSRRRLLVHGGQSIMFAAAQIFYTSVCVSLGILMLRAFFRV